ncbi:TPA: hypothetical protein HA242_05835 [Candidatus Woesearchaeota archaeon]|nr:hypothetical protein [Candidatus Woesearchaeota archaeon]HIG93501.1 hypothetical protein [Candidatus Woesearchaeota archaeon]HIH13216.1 hypothetical protein [Candidatus Woesearchaeota archaeon]
MKCYKCEKAEFNEKKVEFIQLGISLGKFDAFVCPVCEETVFEGSVSKKIEIKAKEAGIWGLARKTRLGTSGSSLDVKVPKVIVDFLNLKKGQEAIIEPTAKNKIQITVV